MVWIFLSFPMAAILNYAVKDALKCLGKTRNEFLVKNHAKDER